MSSKQPLIARTSSSFLSFDLQSRIPKNDNISQYQESFDTTLNEYNDSVDPDIEDTETGWYIILIVLSSCVGGLMFGYDTACISSILYFLDQDEYFTLGPIQKEIVTSITSIGSLIGSLGAALLADKYGRRVILAGCCLVFSAAAVQLSLSTQIWHLIVGRFVVGLAVGAASMIVPVYISEISPSRQRGMLLALNSVFTTGGQFFANLLAFAIKTTVINWRVMFFVSGIPSFLFLLVVGFIPESPRYLILHDKYDEATEGLLKVYPNGSVSQIQKKLDYIREDFHENRPQFDKPLFEKLFGSGPTIRALIVGCSLMVFQQSTGFNSLMYYGTTIFSSIGVGDPLIVSILISGTNFLFTFVALVFIDKVGRRKMLLNTIWIMALGLAVTSIGFTKASDSTLYSYVLMISIVVFVASYASAMGTIPWSSVEFLPLEARSGGSAMIASIGWTSNFIVSASYLSLIGLLGISGTTLIFSGICLIGWFGVFKWYPEVNGLSLEEIRHVFANGIDIHYKHHDDTA